jgi:hypothetical protein
MKRRDRLRHRNGEPEKPPEFHRGADVTAKRFRAWIGENKHCATIVSHKFKRPDRPRSVKVDPQVKFVGEAVETCGGRLLASRRNDDNWTIRPVRFVARPPDDDALSILKQHLLEGDIGGTSGHV